MSYTYRYVSAAMIIPVLEAVKELGGSGHYTEIRDKVIEILEASNTLVDGILPSEHSSIPRRIYMARYYLRLEGCLDASSKGVWILTEKGYKVGFAPHEADELVRKWEQNYRDSKKNRDTETLDGRTTEDNEEDVSQDDNISAKLMETLLSLSPASFERACARLLRELGFEKVSVTGRSHDGGIDGEGLLKVNPLLTLRVVFQCKRYKSAVSREQVSDFENRASKTADKGLFITTGYFSQDAIREAQNNGKQQIELIDGDRLIELLLDAQLGVRQVLEVDHAFFQQFEEMK